MNDYDYRHTYIKRTDPTVPAQSTPAPGSADPAPAPAPDPQDLYAGTFAATLPVIEAVWAQVSPDPATTATMAAVLVPLTEHATAAGFTTWDQIPATLIRRFIGRDKDVGGDTRRLRKNAAHGAYVALRDAGLYDGSSTPTEGIDPVPQAVRADERGKHLGDAACKRKRRAYVERVHVRPASDDEILLIRLATRLAGTTRAKGLPAAAVAICSSSATTTEAPQVLWRHLKEHNMDLAGRYADPGRQETTIAARTVHLDNWAADALENWWQERSEVRPIDRGASVLYTGAQALDSLSAQVSADKQVRKALQIADLTRETGLSAGSLRMWAAARHITTFAGLETGAATAGIEPLTLLRQITQQGDRGFRRCT